MSSFINIIVLFWLSELLQSSKNIVGIFEAFNLSEFSEHRTWLVPYEWLMTHDVQLHGVSKGSAVTSQNPRPSRPSVSTALLALWLKQTTTAEERSRPPTTAITERYQPPAVTARSWLWTTINIPVIRHWEALSLPSMKLHPVFPNVRRFKYSEFVIHKGWMIKIPFFYLILFLE